MFETKSQVVGGAVSKANEMVMLKSVQATLEKHYGGNFWLVGITQSIIIIRNTLLAGDTGYIIHIPAIYSASWLDDEVMRAGGTILEAYKQRRAALRLDDVVTLPVDFAGKHYIPAGAMKRDRKPAEQMVRSERKTRGGILLP
jgi:hypothetical protein